MFCLQSIRVDRSRQQDLRYFVAFHPLSRNRAVSASATLPPAPFTELRVSALFPFSFLSFLYTNGRVSTLINASKITSYRYTWRPWSQVMIDFVKLTSNTNHHKTVVCLLQIRVYIPEFGDTKNLNIHIS